MTEDMRFSLLSSLVVGNLPTGVEVIDVWDR